MFDDGWPGLSDPQPALDIGDVMDDEAAGWTAEDDEMVAAFTEAAFAEAGGTPGESVPGDDAPGDDAPGDDVAGGGGCRVTAWDLPIEVLAVVLAGPGCSRGVGRVEAMRAHARMVAYHQGQVVAVDDGGGRRVFVV